MNRNEFRELAATGILMLDGATGTELSRRGLPRGTCPELWVLEHPDVLLGLQSAYAAAGSRIVYAPTFGGNRFKLAEFGLETRLAELNRELVRLSRRAANGALVFGNMAPIGKFIEPFGDIPFEDAVAAFREQILSLLEGGADGLVVETMIDLQEARAALIAARESCDLPVMVSMTFERDGRTLNGSDPLSALVTLQSLGADAVGCNCSTGPADMIGIIRAMKPATAVPLLAKPNAGMPRLVDGITRFEMSPAEFASFAGPLAEAGVNILGGCCGTTPEHIAMTAEAARGLAAQPPAPTERGHVCSARGTRRFGAGLPLTLIGERINPTGKKALQAELREGSLSMVRQFAQEQAALGAHVLDVNMGMPGIDEKQMMLSAIRLLSRASDLPLCIDSTDPAVMEAALRLYPGRALVNSVSGEKTRIEKTLPIAAKYGAAVIVLPLTDGGIPETAMNRAKIVEDILSAAGALGISRSDCLVDGLAMAVSSDPPAGTRALELIKWCAERGIASICGLSNISFGLPERQWINAAFLAMASATGLSAAIVNPSSETSMNLYRATDALLGLDDHFKRYISAFSKTSTDDSKELPSDTGEITPCEKIYRCVINGEEEAIPGLIDNAIKEGRKPDEIVDTCLIPAIREVGERFDRKEYFLPQLIMSADTMRRGFDHLRPALESSRGSASLGPTVVMATVKGDIHDIGKNIVCLMLKNYGFTVVDLGKDVPAETILSAAVESGASCIGLSALMTTTMVEMKSVTEAAPRMGAGHIPIIIGGAVVDGGYAREIGATGYARDAMEAVRLVQSVTGHDLGSR